MDKYEGHVNNMSITNTGLNENDERISKQYNALRRITHARFTYEADFRTFIHDLTETAADVLSVARVSVWIYNPDHTKIQCVDLFEIAEKKHSDGQVLQSIDYPNYFKALSEERIIAAHDAHHDDQTKEFSKSYLTPLRICAMLDAPILVKGKSRGVICHEHVDVPRQWTSDEQHFASALGDLIGHVLLTEERDRVEKELKESNARFQQLVNNISEVFWLTDITKQSMKYISPSYEKIWGRSCQSLYDNPQSFLDPIHEDDRDRVINALSGQVKGVYDEEYRIVRGDNDIRWIRDRAFPVYGVDESVERIAGIAEDITDRKNAELLIQQTNQELERLVEVRTQELLAAKENAEKASAAKSEFLSSMSHELRTPLNAVLGFGQLLDMKFTETSDITVQQHIKYIMQGGYHLLDLVNEVLDLSSIEAGRLNLSPEPISLHSLITECIRQIDVGLAKEREVAMINQVADQDLEIVADPMRFKQIIINLLSNAVKYNKEGGTVTIKTEHLDNERLRIAITDTGNGIAAADMEKLFDPFERLSYKNSKVVGTGIGLTVTKQLVEAMGGTLGVESRVGQGSTFMVGLPLYTG